MASSAEPTGEDHVPTALEAPLHFRPSAHQMYPFETDTVVEGDPDRRILPAFIGGSAGNDLLGAIWATTPCTLRFETTSDAVMYVIEGTVEVDFDDGSHWDVAPGDVLAVPRGTWATWKFTSAFKEFVVHAG